MISKIIEKAYKYIAYICIILMLVVINFNNFLKIRSKRKYSPTIIFSSIYCNLSNIK